MPTILQKILVSNAEAAKQTLTIADGGAVLNVLPQQPVGGCCHAMREGVLMPAGGGIAARRVG